MVLEEEFPKICSILPFLPIKITGFYLRRKPADLLATLVAVVVVVVVVGITFIHGLSGSWNTTLQWVKGEGIRIRKISDRLSLETRLPRTNKPTWAF